jgi:stage II sporulation protein D
MSQYGAEGDAQHGWSAAKIMAWYYRGTTLAQVSTSTTIRVLMSSGQSHVAIGVRGSGELIDATTGHVVPLSAGVNYIAKPAGAGVLVTGPSGAKVYQAGGGMRVSRTGSGTVALGSRTYRGFLGISSTAGRLTTINTVPVESYVRGVVAWEMPSSWAPAALQAQAIAARSYALASRQPAHAFDVYPDTRSQMYGGITAETASTDSAIRATSGKVVAYHGTIVQAFFFSSSGGYTDSKSDVWGGSPIPYLVGVPDPYDAISPMDRWPNPRTFTDAQVGQSLGLGGPVASIAVLTRGVSPRVMLARVTLDNGTNVTVSGNMIQADLGLPSTWFSVARTTAGGSSSPGVTHSQIAAFVVTHYRYANWHHAATLLVSAVARNPGGVAKVISRTANAHVSAAQVAAFVAAHYAPTRRARATRAILALPAARQVQVLARSVFR